MKTQAFVLHLRRASERRANARELAQDCGVPGEIWDAVDGYALGSSDIETTLDQEVFAPTYPFELEPDEVGKFLSHRQIWAECLRLGLNAVLILEDDAVLDPELFPMALDLALRNVETYGIIQLSTGLDSESPPRLLDKNGPAKLVSPEVTPLDTTAVMVAGWAAQILLAQSGKIDRPLDRYIQSHWHSNIRPCIVYSAGVERLILEDDDGVEGFDGIKDWAAHQFSTFKEKTYERHVISFSRTSPAPDPNISDPGL